MDTNSRHTLLLDTTHNGDVAIELAARLLREGELVAFPTETVYGLGACISNEAQIRKIFEAKKRPIDNPLIAHVHNVAQIETIARELPEHAKKLIHDFFPGPLTVVLERNPSVPALVSAGLNTIAVRMPRHPIARSLIESVGEPLVAPSANSSGRPSPTTAQHVMDDLNDRIAAVLDGGPCEFGIESTVIDLTGSTPTILRPGSITVAQIEESLGMHVSLADHTNPERVASPGMKYRHYAPSIPVVTVTSLADVPEFDSSIRILTSTARSPDVRVRTLSDSTLYRELRDAEHDGCRAIYVVVSPDILENTALMNRLMKASTRDEQ